MPHVRSVQEVDVCRLEILFEDCDGYDDADRVFYMSIYNDKETTTNVGDEHRATLGRHWHDANDRYDFQLKSLHLYVHLRGKMFYVWDGNYRFSAWWHKINNDHSNEAR